MTGYYRGVPIEDMTKEQLIKAIHEMHITMEADRKRYMNRIECCLSVEPKSTGSSFSLLVALKRLISKS